MMATIAVAGSPWPGYRAFPKRLNLAREVLEPALRRGLGDRPALLCQGGSLNYAALHRQVEACAAGFAKLGVNKGDLILIMMGNSPEFAVSFLGAVKLGAIPVLVNSLLSAGELQNVVRQTEPKWAVAEGSRASAVRTLRATGAIANVICAGGAAPSEIAFESLLRDEGDRVETADTVAEEPAFIVYTSGTTGKPKGIVHAHRWIVALGDLNRYRLPPNENDIVMATGEWSFISALGHNLLFPLRNGVTGAALAGRATSDNVLAAIEQYRVTVLYSVATVYRRLLATPGFEKLYNLQSLRCAHSTGEALHEATYHEWKSRIGCEIYEHYGVSEYQLVIGQGEAHPVKPGSVGKPLAGISVAILDDDCQPVPRGELGHFAISTKDPGLFLDYYKDPERTRAVIRNGWYFTGDLAYQDADGYYFIAGRRDDCFKSRGIFISPAEIENALQSHSAVTEAVVFPEPDGEIGNKIRAVVVLQQGQAASAALESIRESLRAQLAPFKLPHTIEFAEALPKNSVGKTLRGSLTDGKEKTRPG